MRPILSGVLAGIVIGALALSACEGGSPVPLLIEPAQAAVAPSQVLAFAVNAPPPVTWTVQEAGGGTVTGAGVYTAPPCGPAVPGTYHVVASSGLQSASATVTVAEVVLGVTVSPATVTLPPGGTAQFTATVTSSCGTSTAVQTLRAPASPAPLRR